MIYIPIFLIGFSIMAIEIVGFRILQFHVGSNSIVTGIILTIVLSALMLGNYGGGFLVKKKKYKTIFYAQLLLVTLYFFICHQFFLLPLLSYDFGNQIWAAFTICVLLYFLPCFILGQNLPFFIKLNSFNNSDHGVNASRVLTISSIGSLIGTISTSLILLPTIGQDYTIKLISLILITIATLNLLKSKKAIILILSMVISFSLFVTKKSTKIVKESLYNKIYIDNSPDHLYLKTSSATDVFIDKKNVFNNVWSLSLIAPAIIHNPKSTLILGLSGGINALQLKRLNSNAEITGVELDKKITESVDELIGYQLKNSIDIVYDDAKSFLRKSKEKYDFIVIDLFKKTQIPEECTTIEFFTKVYEHLTDEGYLSINTYFNEVYFTTNKEGNKNFPLRRLQATLASAHFKYQFHNTLTNQLYVFKNKNMYNSFIDDTYLKYKENGLPLEVKATIATTILKTVKYNDFSGEQELLTDDKSPGLYFRSNISNSHLKKFLVDDQLYNSFKRHSYNLFISTEKIFHVDKKIFTQYVEAASISPISREDLAKYFQYNIKYIFDKKPSSSYLYNYSNSINLFRKSKLTESIKEFDEIIKKYPKFLAVL